MASENETVEEIKYRIYSHWRGCENCSLEEMDGADLIAIADQFEAAHKREVAALKHWIKSAARWIKCHDIYHTSGDDLIKQAKEILIDDGEFLFKKRE